MGKSIDPRTVLSPKASVRNLNVLFDGGLWDEETHWAGWSLAKLEWDGAPAVGVRWNGEEGGGVGNPQSRGLPTWFILPGPLSGPALEIIAEHLGGDKSGRSESLPPRRRLLDLISFVRAASDEELSQMIREMALRPAKAG
jgi:hypothetical protein